MNEQGKILGFVAEGLSPSEIAAACGKSTKEVIQLISTAINEGSVRRSDVLAALRNKQWAELLELFEESLGRESPDKLLQLFSHVHGWDVDADELKLYLAYRKRPINGGDVY